MTRAPHRRPATVPFLGCVLALTLVGSAAGWARAQQDPATRVLTSVNGVRIANGLFPFALDEHLSISAQGHSQDMAAHDLAGHIGSDNSTVEDRIAAAGYPAYSGGIVGAEIVHRGSDDLLNWWMEPLEHRELVLSTRYREVGIGTSLGDDGQTYWTLNFGAQPNVLPIFIDYGAAQTDALTVTLTLSNEGAMIYGDGPQVMGLAHEVRVSNSSTFSDSDWQPWFAETEWRLTPGEGFKSVHVEFRDQEGRKATSQASINRVERAPAVTTTLTPTAAAPAVHPTSAPLSLDLPTSPPAVSDSAGSTPLPLQTGTPVARPVPLTQWLTIRPRDALPWACGLQFVASLLGFIIAARRRQLPREHGKGENGR